MYGETQGGCGAEGGEDFEEIFGGKNSPWEGGGGGVGSPLLFYSLHEHERKRENDPIGVQFLQDKNK